MSESQEPAGEAPRTPIIDHVPETESGPEPKFSAADEPAAREAPAAAGGAPPHAAGVVQPPPRRGGTPLLLTLFLCAGLGGGIYWTWTHPQAAQQDDPQAAIDAVKTDLSGRLAALGSRIDALEKQVGQIQSGQNQAGQIQSGQNQAGASADVGKRLDEIAAQQTQLAAAVEKLQEAAAGKPGGEPPPPAPAAAPAPPPPSAGDAQQTADLASKLDQALAQEKASLDALDQRLGKLEQNNPAATEAQDNKQTIETLASRVQKLEQGEGKLEQTEGQIAGVKQDATLAVKLSAAQVALSEGQPLGALPGAPPALARFATEAPPTEASLRAGFPDVAKAVLAASRPEEAEKSFFSRAVARLEQTVTVRRGDHVIVGDPAAGVVATAQQDLNNDNLQGAVDALSALSGRAAQAAGPWLEQARALLAARAALAQMAAHG